MLKKNSRLAGMLCLFLSLSSLAFERYANYTSALTVNDFAFDKDTVWIATSGGLFRYLPGSGSGTLFSNPSFFPDPCLTSVVSDARGNLWVGSQQGYLTLRPKKGRMKVFATYATSEWKITDLAEYGKFIIVGSDKGCSVFDTEKSVGIKNATSLGSIFLSPQVNTIAIFPDTDHNDTLLLIGCETGFAQLSLTNNNLEKANFYDPGIWTVDTSSHMQVRAFALGSGTFAPLNSPGIMVNGTTVHAESDSLKGSLFINNTKVADFPSVVTAIAGRRSSEVYIGTMNDCFFFWNGQNAVNVQVGGPAFRSATRVYADRQGSIWVSPKIIPSIAQAKQGFSVFKNGGWHLYASQQYPQMGAVLSEGAIYGAVEDQFGRMWFGTWGGQVKRFTKDNNSWHKYCVGAQDFGMGQFFQSVTCHPPDWAKIDAIALDSTGFLWFGMFWSFPGSILCHDPRYEPNPNGADASVRHYRYFFDKASSPYYSENIGCICVDAGNTIIVGDGEVPGNGRILVLRHNGNPLSDGIQVIDDFNDQRGVIYDLAATQDTLTYIATSTGFFTYDPQKNEIIKGLCVRTKSGNSGSLTIVDTALRNIKSVEIEDERFVWLGTKANGLIRYDLTNNTSTVIDQSSGLLSDHIQDITIDRTSGRLWIATDRGVSRYTLGYSVGKKNTGIASVYPNPYSKRRHLEIVFEKLPPKSTVRVYAVGGTLITALSPVENGTGGSACVWKPSGSIVPGIYMYTIRSGGSSAQGKLIITP
ncbi:MAG: T9SS type A sorting domain-containing protein [Chitinispirillaceae bacterium]|nr:T9SS type A sorting domain-containing protein [Chitinispirillaceae bacterium]